MGFRRLTPLLLALLSLTAAMGACAHGETSSDQRLVEPVDRTEWSMERQALEEQFEVMLSDLLGLDTSLGVVAPTAKKEQIESGIREDNEAVLARLASFVDGGEPEEVAWASLRKGQEAVIDACDLERSISEGRVARRSQEFVGDVAELILEGGFEHFEKAHQTKPAASDDVDDGLRLWREQAARSMKVMETAGDRSAVCDALADAWQHGSGEGPVASEARMAQCRDGDSLFCRLLLQEKTDLSWIDVRTAVCENQPHFCAGAKQLLGESAESDEPRDILERAEQACLDGDAALCTWLVRAWNRSIDVVAGACQEDSLYCEAAVVHLDERHKSDRARQLLLKRCKANKLKGCEEVPVRYDSKLQPVYRDGCQAGVGAACMSYGRSVGEESEVDFGRTCRELSRDERDRSKLTESCIEEADMRSCTKLGGQRVAHGLSLSESDERWAEQLPSKELSRPSSLYPGPWMCGGGMMDLPVEYPGEDEEARERRVQRQEQSRLRREERRRQRQRDECFEEGGARACLRAASTMEDTELALPYYQRSCAATPEEESSRSPRLLSERDSRDPSCREVARIKFASGASGSDEAARELLDEQCEEGDSRACMLFAEHLRSEGADAIVEQLQRACDHDDPLGCRALADELIDRQQEFEYHADIVDALERHCQPGAPDNCDVLARYFYQVDDGLHAQSCRVYYQMYDEMHLRR